MALRACGRPPCGYSALRMSHRDVITGLAGAVGDWCGDPLVLQDRTDQTTCQSGLYSAGPSEPPALAVWMRLRRGDRQWKSHCSPLTVLDVTECAEGDSSAKHDDQRDRVDDESGGVSLRAWKLVILAGSAMVTGCAPGGISLWFEWFRQSLGKGLTELSPVILGRVGFLSHQSVCGGGCVRKARRRALGNVLGIIDGGLSLKERDHLLLLNWSYWWSAGVLVAR